jgi:predicted ATPase/DNA-binding CsgD family transcriptional regulator
VLPCAGQVELEGARHNLRAQPAALIGRERILAQLRDALSSPGVRLLTLTGPGGSGKTRLALALAESFLDSFPEGVYLVDLAAVAEPSQVLPAIARTLHIEQVGPSAAEQLFEVVRTRRVLLVLDNFEHVVAAAHHVADVLALCRQVKVIVTSREPIRLSWEHVAPVPPLETPELASTSAEAIANVPAIQLFVERARQVAPSFTLTEANCEAVANICIRLDGLPLAIELAAARTRALGVHGILQRISQRLDFLRGGARDQPSRHETLRSAIAWSHDLLTADERAVFRQLAVWTGSWSLDAARAVCQVEAQPRPDTAEIVEQLAQRSLVQVLEDADPARYRLLETVRQFAAEQLETSTEFASTNRRHRLWCADFAATVAPEYLDPRDVRRLELEYDNLRAALRDAAHAGDADSGLRLGLGLWLYWYILGQYSEGQTWLTRVLSLPSATRAMPQYALALSFAAHLAYCQGDFSVASDLLEQAVTVSSALQDGVAVGLARQIQGNVARGRGELERANALYEEALRLNRETGHWAWESVNLHQRAIVLYEMGRMDEAEQSASAALAIAQLHGHTFARANALQTLGRIAAARGDHTTAESFLNKALDIQQELRYRQGLILTLIALATSALATGNTIGAQQYVAESARLARDSGDRIGLARSMEAAAACRLPGDVRNAVVLFGAADALRDRVSATRLQSESERIQRSMREAAARMTRGSYASAFAEGRRLELDDAIDLTLQSSVGLNGHSTAGFDVLSPRERQVAMLIIDGCTNRQIARRLAITERTAEHHLENIMAKLAVNSRTQVGVWAVEHGLRSQGGV